MGEAEDLPEQRTSCASVSQVACGCCLYPCCSSSCPERTSARASETYTVVVERLVVQGVETEKTDAAVLVISGEGSGLCVGNRIPADGAFYLMYPDIQVYLRDERGNSMVLECQECTEAQPAVLIVGDLSSRKPFLQENCNVVYNVNSDEGGWFEILIDLLVGPGEQTVPIAVEGTHFLVESNSLEFRVTVAAGTVSLDRPNVWGHARVTAGKALLGTSSTVRLETADPLRLRHIQDPSGVSIPTPEQSAVNVELVAQPLVSPSRRGLAGSLLLFAGGSLFVGAGVGAHVQSVRDSGPDARKSRNAAWALYGSGAALLAGGVAWWLLLDSPEAEQYAERPGGAIFWFPVAGGAVLHIDLHF